MTRGGPPVKGNAQIGPERRRRDPSSRRCSRRARAGGSTGGGGKLAGMLTGGVTGTASEPAVIPDPALVVLVGASGSGKSAWATAHYRPAEVVSSDALRGVVGSGEHDLDASADAFAVLESVVLARAGRGLTTVVDTLGLDRSRRAGWLRAARASGLPAVAVRFETPAEVCRERNRQRPVPVPAAALTGQLRQMRSVPHDLRAEGWDLVVPVRSGRATVEPAHSPGAAAAEARQRSEARPLGFVLQLSRFPWGVDPVGWLVSVARAAQEAGVEGIALMDHLIQIPQVGREWEDLPEPFVTLGLLAATAPGLRLGTLVSPLSLRAPGLLAKAVATLDVLTGGRAFCGVGAGWWEREHAAYGLAFPSAAERLRLLEAGIVTLRALWAPGTGPYDDGLVSLPETTCYPRPVGPVPVVVGGKGRRLLAVAARRADAVNLPSDADRLPLALAALRRACAEAGRDPDELAVTVLDVPVIGRDRDHCAAEVERLRGRTPAAAYARAHHAGTAADQVGRFRQLAELGVSTAFVALPGLRGPEDLEPLAGVIAAFR
jgi:alkanesulfonate monooxygenase SsuD/methylene tetrahydromethanopterin reductase-like flavin-dependent oxidoreductase (luciferase family)/predicted kinase